MAFYNSFVSLVIFSVIFQCTTFADQFQCQLYDETSKLFGYYCKIDAEWTILPQKCLPHQFLVESFDVLHTKIRGCNLSSVTYAITACPNINILDISASGYKSIDSFDLNHPRLKTFNASHNELTVIKPNFLARVPSLIECDFSHNKLQTVRPFTGVDQLQRLHLSHNEIDTIADNAFTNLIHLQYIDLRHNRINRIKANLYSNLNHLIALHLEENPIDTLNCENLLKMKTVAVHITWSAVEFLDTDCEGAARLFIVPHSKGEGFFPVSRDRYAVHCNPHSFRSIISFTAGPNQYENVIDLLECFGSTLVGLYLDGNFIGEFNGTTQSASPFERFHDLKELSLRGTQLRKFDIALLERQRHLRTLDISNNRLRRINNLALTSTLDNLIEFSAAQNQFENVPEIMQQLTSAIKNLDLSSNFIGTLDLRAFHRLNGLEVLNLSNTSLSIPDFSTFGALDNLEALDLSYNDFSATDFSTLAANGDNSVDNNLPTMVRSHIVATATAHRHEHLRTLNLSHTNLPIADFVPFDRLRSLETLDISHNRLQRMNFTRLFVKILDLSSNYLGEINANTFDRLKNLVGLKLSNTGLRIRNTNPFGALRKLAVLDISNNDLADVDFEILSPTLNKLFGLQAINCRIKNASNVIQHLGSTLMALDLSKNVIGTLPIEKLKTLRLYSLHLSHANITHFDYAALNMWHLRSLKLSYNQLREINFRATSFSVNSITELNLEGNELMEIRNLHRQHFQWLRSLSISQNQLPCTRLMHIIREWNGKFNDDPWRQKHGRDCYQLNQQHSSEETQVVTEAGQHTWHNF